MLNDLELTNILAGGLQKQADLGGTDDFLTAAKKSGIGPSTLVKWIREAYDNGAKTADDILNYISKQGEQAQQWVVRHAADIRARLGSKLSDYKTSLKNLGVTTWDILSDKANSAWEGTKKSLGEAAGYVKGKWDAGNNAIANTDTWKAVTDGMKAKGLKEKGVEGGDAFLHRMGRSLSKKPLKWGTGALGAAGLLGTGLYAALSGDGSSDSALGQIGNATGEVFDSLGLEDIPDSYRGILAAGALASPVLGAAAGGISGNGMLRGAAQGLGLAGGSYAGYKGGKALADYLDNSDMLSGLGSGGKDAVRLASILGGTALGGIGGTSLAGALVPKGY